MCLIWEAGTPVSSWGRGVNVFLLGRGGKLVSSWGKEGNVCLLVGRG